MAPATATDTIKPRGVCIVGVGRTPMGGFLGSLSSLPATKLGSIVIECSLKRARIHANLVQEVFFGNVLSANLGQAPARQAALGEGIPNSVVCTTINIVCSSGMKQQCFQPKVSSWVLMMLLWLVAWKVCLMRLNIWQRQGSRLGHDMVIDGMLKDGLWDVYNDYAMGMCAELCADQHTITREEQEKLNAHGAVSLGHPLGCSGARILVTLLGVLRQRNGKYGVAGVCNGGGGASALALELMYESYGRDWQQWGFLDNTIYVDPVIEQIPEDLRSWEEDELRELCADDVA